MAKNVALFGRRELQAHRHIVTGVTASVPIYKEIDSQGNKSWVVDVSIGPQKFMNVLKDCPIAQVARHLVGDIFQPVTLERSKQGKYTVIGRTKVLPGGTISPEGDIDDPTYHLVLHNFADLRCLFVPDLDYDLEPLQASEDTQLQADPSEPLQVIRATDAFGNQVLGPEVDLGDETKAKFEKKYRTSKTKVTKKVFIKIGMKHLGPKGDPEAIDWGVGPLAEPLYATEEIIE